MTNCTFLSTLTSCQRVARDGDQVREGAGRNDAELAALAQQLGRARGRRLDRLHGRHAELDLAGEFLGDGIGPRKAADVGAEGDLHSGVQRLAEGDAVHGDALAVALARSGVLRVRVVVIDRQRRHVPGALPQHLRDLRVGEFQAVLDGVAAAIERALQARCRCRRGRRPSCASHAPHRRWRAAPRRSASAARPARPAHRPTSDASCRP